MVAKTLDYLADSLLQSIETEKIAELSKITEEPVLVTGIGKEMQKLAGVMRTIALEDITAEDIRVFRERYGV